MFDIAWTKAILWAEPEAVWAPAALVVLVAALGLTAAGAPPVRRGARRAWLTVIFVCGSLAVAGSAWQTQEVLSRRSVATSASPPGADAALAARVKTLQDQLAQARQPRQTRALGPATAARLAAYLEKSGSRQVSVSAIAGDVEAYDYANQLANVLRAAGWRTGGPEITRAFGDLHAVGVNLFVNPAQTSDTAKILTAAFARFNIPYEPRVTPEGTVPAGDAVELFVGALPGTRIAPIGSPRPFETPPGGGSPGVSRAVGAPLRQPSAVPDVPITAATAGPGGRNAAGVVGQQKGRGQ